MSMSKHHHCCCHRNHPRKSNNLFTYCIPESILLQKHSIVKHFVRKYCKRTFVLLRRMKQVKQQPAGAGFGVVVTLVALLLLISSSPRSIGFVESFDVVASPQCTSSSCRVKTPATTTVITESTNGAFAAGSIFHQSRQRHIVSNSHNNENANHQVGLSPRSVIKRKRKRTVADKKFVDFEDMLNSYREEPILVYFTSSTCGPCKLQRKELAEFQQLLRNSKNTKKSSCMKMLGIEIHKFPKLCSKHNITTLPCIIIMQNSNVVTRFDGFTRANDLLLQIPSVYI